MLVRMAIDKAPASPLAFGIATVLSSIRTDRGLGQKEVAALAGVTQAQVSRWSNARVDMSVQDLIALCEGLGVDLREFLNAARVVARDYERRTQGE